ncbi:UDP-N-acetylmuramate dehydrogenase [Candidatus Omnitrophota bacterium]
MNYYHKLKKSIKGTVRLRESLARHTTFGIGGPAQLLIEPRNLEDIKTILRFAKHKHVPVRIIGAGSNLLIRDRGVKGITLKLTAPVFRTIGKISKECISVGSAVTVPQLLAFTKDHLLGGCEFLAGIPGTVGGALAMNAGICIAKKGIRKERSIGDIVTEVSVIEFSGQVKTLQRKAISFLYRDSCLKSCIILSAKLKLFPKGKARIKRDLTTFITLRRSNQEARMPSAGCVFKNPVVNSAFKWKNRSISAGWLIDQCGLKGQRVNDAVVSQKHANYIINSGNANADDVLKLMRTIQRNVEKKFGVMLEPEIKIID